jgi:hypothetical protein
VNHPSKHMTPPSSFMDMYRAHIETHHRNKEIGNSKHDVPEKTTHTFLFSYNPKTQIFYSSWTHTSRLPPWSSASNSFAWILAFSFLLQIKDRSSVCNPNKQASCEKRE